MWALYDAVSYAGHPSPLAYGIRQAKVYYENQFFSSDDHTQDTTSGARNAIAINALALNLPADSPICLDIECWPLYTVGGGDRISLELCQQALTKYIDTIVGIRAAAPSLQLGYFGIV